MKLDYDSEKAEDYYELLREAWGKAVSLPVYTLSCIAHTSKFRNHLDILIQIDGYNYNVEGA